MLDNAFDALKKFDWGSDLATLSPIEDAVIAAHGKADASQEIEARLVAALKDDLTRDAKEYVCRKLALVGSAACVPALAALLMNKDSSHMARFALERIPADESAKALREALESATGDQKIGIISSLGARRDGVAVEALGRLLTAADPATARSAALALGAIGSSESAKVLQGALRAATANPMPLVDALLSCAEALLSSRKVGEASAIYQSFAQAHQPRIVRLAATRGLLACAGKS